MALVNIGFGISAAGIRQSVAALIGTIDSLKAQEAAVSGTLANLTDADMIAIGFQQADTDALRQLFGALDALVSQGLANATITMYTDLGRNITTVR